MWFLYSLSWLSTIIQLGFIVLSVAAGLYYVAELVEEYTVLTGKIIKILIFINIGLYTGLLIFEELPLTLLICGFISQALHLMLLRTFPFFIVTSLPFIGALIFVFVNHYLAFSYFSSVYYPFSEILAYFTLCLWIVPFTFFISLSANENVLPTFSESRPLISDDNDVVTNYFSRKGKKRYGLLTFFNFAKESILPQRLKKSF